MLQHRDQQGNAPKTLVKGLMMQVKDTAAGSLSPAAQRAYDALTLLSVPDQYWAGRMLGSYAQRQELTPADCAAVVARFPAAPASRDRSERAGKADTPRTVSLESEPVEELYGFVPELVLTVTGLPVTRAELAVSLCNLSLLVPEELINMTREEVRYWAVATMLEYGRDFVRRSAEALASNPPTEPTDVAFLALCESLVDEAFDLNGEVAE